eukprot:TRINITY_DN30637_c0_g1_i1.p1 TRINITY_DN30637_c0_g1~~TRINITY_DN30637_c0_g1_i1.p1  ORF type:complete len:680 (+),score=91.42 TRINITY_DN30637_c0_g1_i1:95-2134(+)
MLPNTKEEWPTTGEGTFNLPPLESAVNPDVMDWRGVRFADVAKGLYYENDSMDSLRDLKDKNVCARTREPPIMDEHSMEWLNLHTPNEILWANMTSMSGLYFLMSSTALKEASHVIGEGFTNSVPVQKAYFTNFHEPTEEDYNIFENHQSNPSTTEDVHRSMKTLTLAVSYSHQNKKSNSLLRANEFQIAQLEDILAAIRDKPPTNTEFVRLWTDGAHRKKMLSTEAKDRPKWILHGLLPYAVFPVALLHSQNEAERASLWTSCEQILADGGLGCLFSHYSSPEIRFPRFGKLQYSRVMPCNTIKTVGDGLSVNKNLTKFAAAIHSGVLDETITYHIADAQELIRLAYYMTRKGNVNVAHGVNCEECLHATFRENIGFVSAFHACADLYNENWDKELSLRLNKTQVSYPYPLVRARKGYVDWHGIRELVPGAGKFAKLMIPYFASKCKKNMHIVSLYHIDTPDLHFGLVVSAYPYDEGPVMYIVLLVHGRNLFGSTCKVLFSVRLNVIDLKKLHDGVQRKELNGRVNELFRHPEMDQLLSQMEFRTFLNVSQVRWGVWGVGNKLNEAKAEDEEGKMQMKSYIIRGVRKSYDMLKQQVKSCLITVLQKLYHIVEKRAKRAGEEDEKGNADVKGYSIPVLGTAFELLMLQVKGCLISILQKLNQILEERVNSQRRRNGALC